MRDASLDHVAIAVRSIASALPLYRDALGATFLFGGDQQAQGFRFAQFRFPSGGKVELITPLGDGFVQRFLDRNGEGVHHITLKTPDIAASLADLTARNVPVFGVALDNSQWKEAFIHPRDAHGALIQIAQAALTDEEMAVHHLTDHIGHSHQHLGESEL